MKIRILLFIFISSSILFLVGYTFWQQEYKFTLPTPVPNDIVVINKGDSVQIPLISKGNESVYFHFFNYDCPCSRFNIKEFESLVNRFDDEVKFYAVLQTNDDNQRAIEKFKSKYNLGIPVIDDPNGLIAKSLGVYSTPQAVIVKNEKLFYKGNYNKARFCLSRNTKFAELALTAMLNGEEPPVFPSVAEIAYGCELPVNSKKSDALFSMFNFQ